MFALLALAGDLGGAVSPSIVGTVSQIANDNLQTGLLVGIFFPNCSCNMFDLPSK